MNRTALYSWEEGQTIITKRSSDHLHNRVANQMFFKALTETPPTNIILTQYQPLIPESQSPSVMCKNGLDFHRKLGDISKTNLCYHIWGDTCQSCWLSTSGVGLN